MLPRGRTRLVVILALFAFAPLHGAVRTWVSTSGIDNAFCSRAEPCRTFGAAIIAVDPGGEIVPLDSGGYGPFTITKSVAIIVPAGIQASIAPTTGTAITITAAASDRVTLRGLFLNNQGNATRGIDFSAGAALHVRNCEVAGFEINLWAQRSVAAETPQVFISDSIFRDGTTGLQFAHTASFGVIRVSLSRCNLLNNDTGLFAGNRARVTAQEVVASANFTGFLTSASAETHLNLDSCVASVNRDFGLSAGAFARMTGCSITHNGTGVLVSSGAVVKTLENNLIEANGVDVAGTLTPLAGK